MRKHTKFFFLSIFYVEKLYRLFSGFKRHNTLVFPGRLRELSHVAQTQVEALEARQQYRDKEVEYLRRQILDYQVKFSLY